MIDFECSQCGNRFRVGDDLAGRHGWCRVCKALIVVPTADAKLPFNKLPAELRVKTLEKLLRHAGIRYEQDRKIMERLQAQLNEAEAERAKVTDSSAALAALEARFDEAQSHIAGLRRELDESAAARGRADEALRQSERRLEEALQAQARLASETQDLQYAIADGNAIAARLKEELASLATGDETAQQSKFVELGDELARVQSDMLAARSRQRELEEAKAWLEQRVAALEKESAHNRDEAERLRVLAAKANETERDLAAMKARYEEAARSAEESARQIAQTSDRLGRAESEAAHLEEERKQLRQALVNAKEEVDGFERRLADMNRLADQAERLRTDLDEVRAAKFRAEDRIAELEIAIETAREEAVRQFPLTAGADEGEAAVAAAVADAQAAEAAARHEAMELRRRAEDGERNLTRLREEHEALREQAGEAGKAQDALRLVEARLEEAHSQIDGLTRRLAEQARALALSESARERNGENGAAAETVIPMGPPPNGAARGFAGAGAASNETLVPELLDENGETDDALMDALLRFIGQQG